MYKGQMYPKQEFSTSQKTGDTQSGHIHKSGVQKILYNIYVDKNKLE